jgi:hypothetical protein
MVGLAGNRSKGSRIAAIRPYRSPGGLGGKTDCRNSHHEKWNQAREAGAPTA